MKYLELRLAHNKCLVIIPVCGGGGPGDAAESKTGRFSAGAGMLGGFVRKDVEHWSEWPSLKSLQITNAGESGETREPSYTVGGDVS